MSLQDAGMKKGSSIDLSLAVLDGIPRRGAAQVNSANPGAHGIQTQSTLQQERMSLRLLTKMLEI